MKKLGKYLIYVQMILVLFSGLLISMGFPRSFRYITDFVTVMLLLCILAKKEKKALLQHKWVILFMLLWVTVTAVTAFMRGFTPIWMLWACRNWCRGFIFFIACVFLLEQKDAENIIKLCKVSYVLNFVLVLLQFVFLGEKGDYLGGIFGNEVGCNGYTNVFLCILLIISIAESYKLGRMQKFTCFVLLSSMILAALEEIKIFYYEYPVIIVLSIGIYFFARKGNKALLAHICGVAVLGFLVSLIILGILFPESFKIITGVKSYSHYEETSRAAYKLSRSHGISEINEKWFGDSWSLRLFGLGLGNCETAGFDFLVSDFSRLYHDWNYMFCCHHILYLEGGLTGLILYSAVFLVMFVRHAITVYRSRRVDVYLLFGILFPLVTIVGIVYNNGLRTELQYLIYAILAISYNRESEPV